MVIDPCAGAVLSVAEDKLEALSSARKVLRAADGLRERPGTALGMQAPLCQTKNCRPSARPALCPRPLASDDVKSSTDRAADVTTAVQP
jgi:hypothetical protein